jgi:hypothetical protein
MSPAVLIQLEELLMFRQSLKEKDQLKVSDQKVIKPQNGCVTHHKMSQLTQS